MSSAMGEFSEESSVLGADVSVADRIAAEALIVDVDGYEGPLDVLLTLSRTQKVDLRKISVLHLAQQYLLFIEQAKSLRIELAADYLVMAAWLTFLKSRLLLPPDPAEDGPSGENRPHIWHFNLSGFRRCAKRRRNSWRGTGWGGISLHAAFPSMFQPSETSPIRRR